MAKRLRSSYGNRGWKTSFGIHFEQRGDLSDTMKFLERALSKPYLKYLEKYGKMGVEALREATPKDTGKTSESWYYKIIQGNGYEEIVWENSNVVNHVPIAIILQYGHATRNGGYVRGRDYINPAIQPIFDQMAENAWKEVTKK